MEEAVLDDISARKRAYRDNDRPNVLKRAKLGQDETIQLEGFDRTAFQARVSTFRLTLWPAFSPASPLECAARGFHCVGVDLISCVSCKAVVCGHLPLASDTLVYRRCADVLKDKLRSAHADFCPWKSRKINPAWMTVDLPSQNLLGHTDTKLRQMMSHGQALPRFTPRTIEKLGLESLLEKMTHRLRSVDGGDVDGPVVASSLVLTVCGWKVEGAERKVPVLACDGCNRRCGMWLSLSLEDAWPHSTADIIFADSLLKAPSPIPLPPTAPENGASLADQPNPHSLEADAASDNATQLDMICTEQRSCDIASIGEKFCDNDDKTNDNVLSSKDEVNREGEEQSAKFNAIGRDLVHFDAHLSGAEAIQSQDVPRNSSAFESNLGDARDPQTSEEAIGGAHLPFQDGNGESSLGSVRDEERLGLKQSSQEFGSDPEQLETPHLSEEMESQPSSESMDDRESEIESQSTEKGEVEMVREEEESSDQHEKDGQAETGERNGKLQGIRDASDQSEEINTVERDEDVSDDEVRDEEVVGSESERKSLSQDREERSEGDFQASEDVDEEGEEEGGEEGEEEEHYSEEGEDEDGREEDYSSESLTDESVDCNAETEEEEEAPSSDSIIVLSSGDEEELRGPDPDRSSINQSSLDSRDDDDDNVPNLDGQFDGVFEEKTPFNPLSSHFPWCCWVKSAEAEESPGWKTFLGKLSQLLEDGDDVREEPKTSPPEESSRKAKLFRLLGRESV